MTTSPTDLTTITNPELATRLRALAAVSVYVERLLHEAARRLRQRNPERDALRVVIEERDELAATLASLREDYGAAGEVDKLSELKAMYEKAMADYAHAHGAACAWSKRADLLEHEVRWVTKERDVLRARVEIITPGDASGEPKPITQGQVRDALERGRQDIERSKRNGK